MNWKQVKELDKNKILEWLDSSDVAPQKAIIALYHRQTFREKMERRTIDKNYRGFNKDDAQVGSYLARQFLNRYKTKSSFGLFGTLCNNREGISQSRKHYADQIERSRCIAKTYARQLARIGRDYYSAVCRRSYCSGDRWSWENQHNFSWQIKHLEENLESMKTWDLRWLGGLEKYIKVLYQNHEGGHCRQIYDECWENF